MGSAKGSYQRGRRAGIKAGSGEKTIAGGATTFSKKAQIDGELSKKDIRMLDRLSRTGTMPEFDYGFLPDKSFNSIYEAINSRYGYPSEQYLRDIGWIRGIYDGFRARRREDGTRYLAKELYARTREGGVSRALLRVPTEVTRNAVSGYEKHVLYEL